MKAKIPRRSQRPSDAEGCRVSGSTKARSAEGMSEQRTRSVAQQRADARC